MDDFILTEQKKAKKKLKNIQWTVWKTVTLSSGWTMGHTTLSPMTGMN